MYGMRLRTILIRQNRTDRRRCNQLTPNRSTNDEFGRGQEQPQIPPACLGWIHHLRPRAMASCRLALVVTILLVVTGCAHTERSLLAIRCYDENDVGRYIGGGALGGEARRRHEGVWARDYAGLDVFRVLELRWSHSKRYRQGGMGSY